MMRLRLPKQFFTLLLLILCLGFFLHQPMLAAEEKAFAFPEMRGWKLEGNPHNFKPENLFEYIDGAADLYLDYRFQQLSVAEYKGKNKAGVTIEIYRHKDNIQAFGIYSQERLAEAKWIELGAQGYYEPNVMNFISGPFYVKLSSYNIGEADEKILLSFAKKIEESLGGKTALPAILASFPGEGEKNNTEKFISKNFLGYPFFHSGYTADYEADGKKFKIFIIEGKDGADCREMLEHYFKRIGLNTKPAEESRYPVKDPYHGDVEMVWKGKKIGGIMGLTDQALRSQYLLKLKKNL